MSSMAKIKGKRNGDTTIIEDHALHFSEYEKNFRSMKTKKTEINCNTIEDVTHTTNKIFYTLKKDRVLKFPLRQKCQPRVFWMKNRHKQCFFWGSRSCLV